MDDSSINLHDKVFLSCLKKFGKKWRKRLSWKTEESPVKHLWIHKWGRWLELRLEIWLKEYWLEVGKGIYCHPLGLTLPKHVSHSSYTTIAFLFHLKWSVSESAGNRSQPSSAPHFNYVIHSVFLCYVQVNWHLGIFFM